MDPDIAQVTLRCGPRSPGGPVWSVNIPRDAFRCGRRRYCWVAVCTTVGVCSYVNVEAHSARLCVGVGVVVGYPLRVPCGQNCTRCVEEFLLPQAILSEFLNSFIFKPLQERMSYWQDR